MDGNIPSPITNSVQFFISTSFPLVKFSRTTCLSVQPPHFSLLSSSLLSPKQTFLLVLGAKKSTKRLRSHCVIFSCK